MSESDSNSRTSCSNSTEDENKEEGSWTTVQSKSEKKAEKVTKKLAEALTQPLKSPVYAKGKARLDVRTVDEFKKDIKFGTALETFFMKAFIADSANHGILVSNVRDNGADNGGAYIHRGNTSGADYQVDLIARGRDLKDHPLEVKWVPTRGKFTLKEADVKSYIREGASILILYNTSRQSLRRPKDHDLQGHLKKIKAGWKDIVWGILYHDKLVQLHQTMKALGRIEQIPYMGDKLGFVVKYHEFNNWLTMYHWKSSPPPSEED